MRRALLVSALLAPLAPLVAAYEPGWQNSYGSPGGDRAGGHDIDKQGDTIIAMTVGDVPALSRRELFGRQVTAPPCQPVNGAAACGGASDIVLQKTDTRGKPIWTAAFGTAGADVAQGVSASTSSYYVSGTASGQAFVAKLAVADGKVEGFTPFSPSNTFPTDVKVHPVTGDVFVAGYETGGIDGCFAKGAATSDAFLCKFNPTTLARVFCVPLGSTAGSNTTMHPGGSISFDHHGYVYFAGTTTGSVNASTPNLGGKDAWAAKFDVNGNRVMAWNFGTDKDDEGAATAVDWYNDWLFIAGTTDGEMATDGVNHGGKDFFLSRTQNLDTNDLNYTALYGGPGDDIASDILAYKERIFTIGSLSPQGKAPWVNDTVYLFYGADTWGGWDFVTCELVHVDNRFADTYPYVATGVMKWCSLWGSSNDDYGRSVRIDEGWNLTYDGDTKGQWGTYTGTPLPFRGGETDVVLQQYYEYETPVWATKTANAAASTLRAGLTCSGGALATDPAAPTILPGATTGLPVATTAGPTATAQPTGSVAPTGTSSAPATATATGTLTVVTTTSRPAGAGSTAASMGALVLALVFAVFAAL
ncbi:hypothetical protein DFJ74DRAFT_673577 [Hyaloraphidium curvatum]|nr:hypothetical protein DFJ74DRAFT_673577 [Hyaloraphidium curvatum]